MTTARLKHFGWGREGEGMTPEEEAFVLGRHRARFGVERFDERPPPRLADLVLPPPRLVPPAALASCCSSETYDRAAHTYGKSFVDTVRGLEGDYASAPDVVAWGAARRNRRRRRHGLGWRRAGRCDAVRRRQ